MTPLNCAGSPPVTQDLPTKQVEWSRSNKTAMEQLAEKRAIALEAQAAMYRSVDPLLARAQKAAVRSQQYWEAMVLDAGKRAMLSPQKARRVEAWLANWLGLKSNSMGMVREPLLNMKRVVEGSLREASVYSMMAKNRDLADTLKAVAKKRGAEVKADDIRRLLEEGLTPQRLNVYGNSSAQRAALTARYNQMNADFIARGFTEDDLAVLLDKAMTVSSQLDELQAVSMATGMNVGDLYNIGYFPRQFTEDGYRAARLAGVLDDVDTEASDFAIAALSKSRKTWEYLPEDEVLAAKMLGVTPTQLNDLIADPVNFAEFLSTRVSGDQLDLLVDSGVFSKIPMLTSHVEEYLTRVYQIPTVDAGLFIADPVAASAQLTRNLQQGAENSALIKYLKTEGFKSGWVVTKEMVEAEPKAFVQYVKLGDVPQFASRSDNLFLHPSVAANLQGIVRMSSSPGYLAEGGRVWTWFTTTFAKQALGNPLTANVYLSGQFLGNMLAAFGRGVAPRHFMTAIADIVKVSTLGLDSIDNTRPFRYIDGKPVTQRELVARTLRMFSRDILPGVSGANMVLDLNQLNPVYIAKQLRQLSASSDHIAGYAGEVAKLAQGKADAVLTPVLKMAQILDLAGQLAIVKGKAQLDAGDIGNMADAAEQLALGWSAGKLQTWDDLVLEVKRGIPMFDDLGKIPGAVASFVPFSSWAIANAPLQLKSMVREPSRWYNYMRAHALWNQAQLSADGTDNDPRNSEMQEWERDEYGIITQLDPANRTTHIMMTSNYDPRWGALTGLFKTFGGQSPEDIREGTRSAPGSKLLQQLIGSSYLGGVYEAASGINPRTGVRRDDSPFAYGQFANIPMPGWMAAVLSVSPVLSSLDRLEAISGTKAILDPRTGSVIQPAVQGWLKNKGTLTRRQLEGVEAVVQVLGARIRVIDGIRNFQYTESDIRATMLKLQSKALTEQKQLALDLKAGTIGKDSAEYTKREQTIIRMYATTLQLNTDLARVEAWAVLNQIPPKDALRKMQERGLVMDNMPLPAAEQVGAMLDQYQQQTRQR